MAFDDAYHALTDHDDDARWAYGTGFTDPLAGVPGDLPDGVDRTELAAYCLMLGDDALILSHRLQQWVTRSPELEDELALANIGLDLLGQARLLLTRAGVAEGWGRDEDDLAMRRDPSGFRNVCLAERADADFAHLVARLFALSTWRLALLDRLTASRDPMLAAIAAKGVKEVTYHRDYAAQWVVRLGDGTPLSHDRMLAAVETLTPQLAELFRSHPTEIGLASVGVAVDPATLEAEFTQVWTHVLQTATLLPPTASLGGGAAPSLACDPAAEVSGVPAGIEQERARPWGRDGEHTPALAEILDEMQGVARSVPGGVW
ncbi:phenylacetate-CoA oxygenase subunit PaaI [Actinoplanes lobatus]|uniref:Phenylacetate-CoA oxygenase subunit PaaI n=1 Tax=Actinoplanes lobatus TaxID=113568 RepID=A0A7W7HNR5_9ACTN|nr:1,2-phenylacetyl-CoA epoxidase subunit PaaC [Actinoplanes lobatus]MBB4753908.1 ring-1,2-phenylacetyl-CoA epoxidase subunit PaaC [Actinoplanes lobatus]GGN97187.1 phenylacetate-CoA oxygenase subunit PaaI [Actinoplanes lobatus]GIE45523.1 phenylacetate-CoA oxygenase subunit PaaI [Actinoplanes lobatus]